MAVVVASPHRTDPPCPAVARGRGCQWQHVALDGQRALKREVVVDALRRLSRQPDPPVAGTVALPGEAYRSGARLAVLPDGTLGYRRHHGHGVMGVDACAVLYPLLEELVRVGRYGRAREVELRAGARTGERLVGPIRWRPACRSRRA